MPTYYPANHLSLQNDTVDSRIFSEHEFWDRQVGKTSTGQGDYGLNTHTLRTCCDWLRLALLRTFQPPVSLKRRVVGLKFCRRDIAGGADERDAGVDIQRAGLQTLWGGVHRASTCYSTNSTSRLHTFRDIISSGRCTVAEQRRISSRDNSSLRGRAVTDCHSATSPSHLTPTPPRTPAATCLPTHPTPHHAPLHHRHPAARRDILRPYRTAYARLPPHPSLTCRDI